MCDVITPFSSNAPQNSSEPSVSLNSFSACAAAFSGSIEPTKAMVEIFAASNASCAVVSFLASTFFSPPCFLFFQVNSWYQPPGGLSSGESPLEICFNYW